MPKETFEKLCKQKLKDEDVEIMQRRLSGFLNILIEIDNQPNP